MTAGRSSSAAFPAAPKVLSKAGGFSLIFGKLRHGVGVSQEGSKTEMQSPNPAQGFQKCPDTPHFTIPKACGSVTSPLGTATPEMRHFWLGFPLGDSRSMPTLSEPTVNRTEIRSQRVSPSLGFTQQNCLDASCTPVSQEDVACVTQFTAGRDQMRHGQEVTYCAAMIMEPAVSSKQTAQEQSAQYYAGCLGLPGPTFSTNPDRGSPLCIHSDMP